MKHFRTNMIALAIGCVFSAGAFAQGISKDEYKAGEDKIASDYKSAKAACGAFSGNAKDICVVDAKGKERVAKADLEASFKPSVKTRYQARVVKAEAGYKVAKERCDDLAGNAKDVCVTEAQAARTADKADAKAEMKISNANAMASEKSSTALSDAAGKSQDARRDAAADKLDAEYEVAKEKCDTYAGDTKESCLSEAKARLGKS